MSNKKENYHIYSHKNPQVLTLGDFITNPDSLGIGLDLINLLNYQDENSNYNLDNLIERYSKEELDKFDSLIQQIKDKRVKTTETISATTSSSNNENISNSTANVDKTKMNPKDFIKYKNESALQTSLKVDNAFLNHKISLHNQSLLNKLYDANVKLLFQKFIYMIETTTPYLVVIDNTRRDLKNQRKQIAAGNSTKEFSHHMTGMAADIYLKYNTTTAAASGFSINVDLTKDSTKKEWRDEGIIKISDSLKLTWGGTFNFKDKKGRYDVVHFDCGRYFDIDEPGYLKAIKKQEDVKEEEAVTSTTTSDNSTYVDLPIKMGTVLNIPLSSVDRQVLTTETNQAVNSTDYESFLAKELVRLLSDKGYKRIYTPTNKKEQFKGTVQEIYPHISVWVWSRALSIDNVNPTSSGNTIYEHQLINITPYITSLNTSVAENGGNFNLTISAIVGEVRGGSWNLKEGSQKDSSDKNKKYHVNSGHVHFVKDDELKRSSMFFEKALQANDIVFIKFEQLEIEDDREDLNELDIISIDKLPNQIFDMIALVDNVNISTSFENVDCNISVVGRDLVKLLIEDGVYFYPTIFTDSGIFANTGSTNNRLERFNGEILNRFQTANKSIERSLKFLLNNLGEIEICPSNLFDSYGSVKLDKESGITIDKRSNFYQLVDKRADGVDKQLQKIADKKEKILDNINKIRSSNKIYTNSDIGAYNIIHSFLSKLVSEKSITLQGQKIKTWDLELEDKTVEKDRIPNNLDGVLVNFERFWIKNKNRVLNKIGLTSVASQLQDLYEKTDKEKIVSNKLLLFNNLSRGELERKIRLNHIDTISVGSIISELEGYMKIAAGDEDFDDVNRKLIFNSNDIDQIKSSYNSVLDQANTISIAVSTKLFDELNSDEQAVFNDIYNLIIEERSINKDVKTTEELVPMLGIWQIIKLVIDDSVISRRIADASIGNENGSLLNAIRKICQDPFCEFYTDTYGDQFYFIARKKPFDSESVKSMLDGRVVYEKYDLQTKQISQDTAKSGTVIDSKTINDSTKIKYQNILLDIEEMDVINDSLSYSTEAYSWYKLNVANLTSGPQSTMAFAYLRAVYFEEFADVYGSKPLDLTTSYIPYSPVLDKNKELPTAYFIQQAVYDLKYMIESHAYLPFTRMGTITINGDRRIKRGTFIRYKGTGEIFYVDSVSHSYSIGSTIDRTTTIQVSRGMVEKFISGVSVPVSNASVPPFSAGLLLNTPLLEATTTVNVSYFNICSLPIDVEIFKNKNSTYSQFQEGSLKNWKVNKSVFNFFLKKLQFNKEYI